MEVLAPVVSDPVALRLFNQIGTVLGGLLGLPRINVARKNARRREEAENAPSITIYLQYHYSRFFSSFMIVTVGEHLIAGNELTVHNYGEHPTHTFLLLDLIL